jgi:hypothetical protein
MRLRGYCDSQCESRLSRESEPALLLWQGNGEKVASSRSEEEENPAPHKSRERRMLASRGVALLAVLISLPSVAQANEHGPVFGLATPTNVKGGWSLDITAIVNNDRGVFTDENGAHAIATQSAMSVQTLDLPLFTTLLSFGAPNVSVQSQGMDTINGQATQKILISPQAATDDPFGQLRSTAWTMTVWIGSSGLPVQIAYTRLADSNPTASITRIRQYSGWQTVNGLEVPFHQEDYAGSQHVFTLQIQSVQFDTGLTDTDFVVPQVQQ